MVAMPERITWTNIEDLGYALAQTHPDVDPLSVRFTELRRLVEQLSEFEAEPGHNVNEQILEAIQQAWYEESQDIEHDEDEKGYSPPNALRPDG